MYRTTYSEEVGDIENRTEPKILCTILDKKFPESEIVTIKSYSKKFYGKFTHKNLGINITNKNYHISITALQKKSLAELMDELGFLPDSDEPKQLENHYRNEQI